MDRTIHTLLITSFVFASAVPAAAETFAVSPDGSGDFPAIQAAIDAARDGDEILLSSGTFSGDGNRDVDFRGKAITVRSATGHADDVVVDCVPDDPRFGPRHAGFSFRSDEGPGSVLSEVTVVSFIVGVRCVDASPTIENVSLRHGGVPTLTCEGSAPLLRGCVLEANTLSDSRWSTSHRGTISLRNSSDARLEACTVRGNASSGLGIDASSPVVDDCAFEGNQSWHGGGIEVRGQSSPWIERCAITGNGSVREGGGLYLVASGGAVVTFTECTISGNHAGGLRSGGGAWVQGDAAIVFDRCTITGNQAHDRGGALYLNARHSLVLRQCTITANRSARGGGLFVRGGSVATLERTILWGNCASSQGADLYVVQRALVELNCVDLSQAGTYFYGPVELQTENNIDADPIFCRPLECEEAPASGGIYTVSATSPALAHACGAMGSQGAACTVSIEPSSWGAIKSRYR